MANYYWTTATWGENPVHDNWQEIVSAANARIDDYIEEYGLDPDTDADQIKDFSDLLAEDWLTLDLLPEELRKDDDDAV